MQNKSSSLLDILFLLSFKYITSRNWIHSLCLLILWIFHFIYSCKCQGKEESILKGDGFILFIHVYTKEKKKIFWKEQCNLKVEVNSLLHINRLASKFIHVSHESEKKEWYQCRDNVFMNIIFLEIVISISASTSHKSADKWQFSRES